MRRRTRRRRRRRRMRKERMRIRGPRRLWRRSEVDEDAEEGSAVEDECAAAADYAHARDTGPGGLRGWNRTSHHTVGGITHTLKRRDLRGQHGVGIDEIRVCMVGSNESSDSRAD